jgi:peptidoglycan/xylan/chitin deacetylase (PgdA/CDA1 family)
MTRTTRERLLSRALLRNLEVSEEHVSEEHDGAMAMTRRTFLAAASSLVLTGCAAGRRGAALSTTTTGTAGSPPPASPPGPADLRPARFVAQGSPNGVAFTFHGSGDPALLHALLGAAARAGAPITVFAVGSWLDQYPDVARAILADGHELANHTYTHPALGTVGRAAVAGEITRCRDALTRHAGSPGAWFRPSGIDVPTPLMLDEAARAGYATVVGYDVDPRDYEDPPVAAVIERVTSGLHPGAIVSLHTGHTNTVDAFEAMVGAARHRNLTPRLVRDLVAL